MNFCESYYDPDDAEALRKIRNGLQSMATRKQSWSTVAVDHEMIVDVRYETYQGQEKTEYIIIYKDDSYYVPRSAHAVVKEALGLLPKNYIHAKRLLVWEAHVCETLSSDYRITLK